MLGSIRKFSSTIYAKILLAVIIIPFIFWGMGSSIRGGTKNIIVEIDKEKYSIQQFSDFINRTAEKKVEAEQIEKFLYAFIGEKLIEKEVENIGIKFTDNSLSKLIKHQKDFKRDEKFSRAEYEKFLLKNNITAIDFESILSKEERKKQLLDFISGGISPPKFLVNRTYDKINQKRSVELINLNDVYKKELNLSDDQIKDYFENNKNKYSEVYKYIKLLELDPKKLVGDNEFTDLFYKKVDEIDDLIIVGEELDYIIQKFNLEKPISYTINKSGKDINPEKNKKISNDLVGKIFNVNESEPTVLIEDKDNYFIIKLIKTEKIKMNIEDQLVRKKIISDLSNETKRKLTSEIIGKINNNNFSKLDFNKISKDGLFNIQKINFKNKNDDRVLEKEIVNQIYAFPKKKIIVVSDLAFSKNYLIYIDKIENVTIDHSSEEYIKYLNLSKAKIVNDLYNTYDSYIKERYKIEINYQALDVVKNYFN